MRVRRAGAGEPCQGRQWQRRRNPLACTSIVHHNIITAMADNDDGLWDSPMALPLRRRVAAYPGRPAPVLLAELLLQLLLLVLLQLIL